MDRLALARDIAGAVRDPELPMLTLADLGVLREVRLGPDESSVVVTLTPTYTACPALATMRADIQIALRRNGFCDIEVHTSLTPAWSTDWISARGLRALAAAGIAPPGIAPPGSLARAPAPTHTHPAPVPVVLGRRPPSPACPRCGSPRTREQSRFGSTACQSRHVCDGCLEPFDHVKEI